MFVIHVPLDLFNVTRLMPRHALMLLPLIRDEITKNPHINKLLEQKEAIFVLSCDRGAHNHGLRSYPNYLIRIMPAEGMKMHEPVTFSGIYLIRFPFFISLTTDE